MLENSSQGLQWFALRVKSNRERVTALGLEGKGFEVFLPQYQRPTKTSAKAKEAPLFPGYLFCKFDVQHRLPILTLPGIVHILGFGQSPAPVEESEVASLRLLLQAGLPVNPNEEYYVGQQIHIDSGPLSGAFGIVTGVTMKRLVVSITLLQRSVSVDLQQSWLQPG